MQGLPRKVLLTPWNPSSLFLRACWKLYLLERVGKLYEDCLGGTGVTCSPLHLCFHGSCARRLALTVCIAIQMDAHCAFASWPMNQCSPLGKRYPGSEKGVW